MKLSLGDVMSIEEYSSRLEEEVKDLGDRVSRLEGRVEELSKRIGDLRNDMNHRFAELSKRIDDLKSDMNFRFNILTALMICVLGAILGVLFKLILSP